MSKERVRREQQIKERLVNEIIDELRFIATVSPAGRVATNSDFFKEKTWKEHGFDPNLEVGWTFILTNIGGYDEVTLEVTNESFIDTCEEEEHSYALLTIINQSHDLPGKSDVRDYVFYLDKDDNRKKVSLHKATGVDIDEDWFYDKSPQGFVSDMKLTDIRELQNEVGKIFGLALHELV